MRKCASFFISTGQGKTSSLSYNQINIPQKVCLYLAVMNLSSQSVAKLNKLMLYWTQWARHPGRPLDSPGCWRTWEIERRGRWWWCWWWSHFTFLLPNISTTYNDGNNFLTVYQHLLAHTQREYWLWSRRDLDSGYDFVFLTCQLHTHGHISQSHWGPSTGAVRTTWSNVRTQRTAPCSVYTPP